VYDDRANVRLEPAKRVVDKSPAAERHYPRPLTMTLLGDA
jgi:hypothetical protein